MAKIVKTKKAPSLLSTIGKASIFNGVHLAAQVAMVHYGVSNTARIAAAGTAAAVTAGIIIIDEMERDAAAVRQVRASDNRDHQIAVDQQLERKRDHQGNYPRKTVTVN